MHLLAHGSIIGLQLRLAYVLKNKSVSIYKLIFKRFALHHLHFIYSMFLPDKLRILSYLWCTNYCFIRLVIHKCDCIIKQ